MREKNMFWVDSFINRKALGFDKLTIFEQEQLKIVIIIKKKFKN
jgi:hypothetical protein